MEIRYDPFDVGIAYAYVRGQWVKCVSEYYAIFKGRSEKEIWLATAELQKRKSNHQKQLKVRAKKLAEFLSTAEAEEVLLVQRLRDTQGREVFNIIDSGENKDEFLEPSNLTKIVAVVDSDKHLESLPHQDMPTQKPPSLQLFDSY